MTLDDPPPACIKCGKAPPEPLRTRCAPCQAQVELHAFAVRNARTIADIRVTDRVEHMNAIACVR